MQLTKEIPLQHVSVAISIDFNLLYLFSSTKKKRSNDTTGLKATQSFFVDEVVFLEAREGFHLANKRFITELS